MVKVGKKVMAGPADTYLSYLKPWANLSNTPFQKYKNFSFEGGIATPLIIHWSKGIKEKGGIRKTLSHEIDIMPTIVDLAGGVYPQKYKDTAITPSPGLSLVPTFTGKEISDRAIYWEHETGRAMRLGKWKIVSGGILNGNYGSWKTYFSLPWRLYDMQTDRSELTDLSGQYPEKVQQMVRMWNKWANSSNVYPMPWKEEKRPARADYMSTPWEFPNF
jgi:arylsulfatase